MATGFNTQIINGVFYLQFETDKREKYEYVQAAARDCLDGKVTATFPRWISVKERLPEEGKLVLFIPTMNQGSVYVGKMSHVGAKGGVLFENRNARTTMKYYAKYWMPLPEPPEVNGQ